MSTWRKVGCCLIAAVAAFGAGAATYRVTPDAAGGGNGQAWADDGAGNAPMTLAEAVAGANTGDTVLLKIGTYTPTATLSIKGISLRGGLAGTDDTACSSDRRTNR